MRGSIGTGQVGGAVELRLRIVQPRLRLGDLGRERGHLLRAHTSIDVVAIGAGGGKGCTRLANRRGQLEGGQLGDDIARTHAVAFANLDGGKLAADLRRHANLGGAHHADDGRGLLGPPQEIAARACRNEDQAERYDGRGPAASHGGAST